jgi:hypothetical protein
MGILYQPMMMSGSCGVIVTHKEEDAPFLFCPPKIPHGLPHNWPQVSVVRTQLLNTRVFTCLFKPANEV